ncbi:hypothetical protein ACQYAD_18285 [Neobacillus sp. SM06]|uniref:hypothetical protein n=1 Tax=Neobacillus sp. SM06 TaxID=3422492 RepID=UPI003D2D5DA2
MVKKYHLDPGYVTIPEANEIVLRILRIVNKGDKSHYNKILEGAKKGIFGGKKHGSRMYQVRKDDIVQYAEECLQNEKANLFNVEIAPNEIEKLESMPNIDNNTASRLYYYLKSLRFYEIISQDIFQKGEKRIIMSLNFGKISAK